MVRLHIEMLNYSIVEVLRALASEEPKHFEGYDLDDFMEGVSLGLCAEMPCATAHTIPDSVDPERKRCVGLTAEGWILLAQTPASAWRNNVVPFRKRER